MVETELPTPAKRALHATRGLLLLTLATFAPATILAAQGDPRAMKQRLRDEIATWSIVPKVDISVAGVFHVQPDGAPTDARQGKLKAGYGLSTAGRANQHRDCMTKGLQYSPYLGTFDLDRESVRIGLFACSEFVIHFGRQVRAADLEPAAVARALSGFFDIRGPNVSQGLVESAVEQALFPIVVEAERAFFQGLAFEHPPGWRAVKYGTELYYQAEGKREIRVRSRALEPAEVQGGAELLLEEVLPGRLLKSARRIDPDSRVTTIARTKYREPLAFGWAAYPFTAARMIVAMRVMSPFVRK